MGQWDVHGFLKENPGRWFTGRQMSERLGVSVAAVWSGARKLRRSGLIDTKTMKWASKLMRSSKDILAYRFKKG